MDNREINICNIPTPIETHTGTVLPEWIDFNDHMYIAYYVLAFDHGTDGAFDYFGLGEDYCIASNNSSFTLELHVNYFNEIRLREHFQIRSYLLDVAPKRMRLFHEMHCRETGKLIATNENMLVHINMETRRSAPYPEEKYQWLQKIVEAHGSVPRPEQAGRSISI